MTVQLLITEKTYTDRAIAFIEANGGEGFIICRRECSAKGDTKRREATPEQWKAWRNYFLKIGKSVVFMDKQDYFTVPSEWPHLFDAGA